MKKIEALIEEYYQWLRKNTFIREHKGSEWIQISTPFWGIFNDAIELYAKKNAENEIVLSDDGLTLFHLQQAGVDIMSSPKRKQIFLSIIRNYGIQFIEDTHELLIKASVKDFPQKKHRLISALLEVNDMFMLSRPLITSIFKEEVRNFLDELKIVYTPDFIARGTTGLEFTFDFLIAYRDQEIVIKSFNNLTKQNLVTFLFSWEDIKPQREHITGKEVKGIAIINDKEKEINKEYTDALASRNANYILWSQRYNPNNISLLKPA